MKYLKSNLESVNACVEALKKGGVVLIPTDTVYGFSAVVDEKLPTDTMIRKIKGREETKPFIQLIGNPSDIYKYTDDKIPEYVLKIWPGPLTVIVNNKLTGSTTAFRCPDDPWLREILNKLGKSIYSTSANRSGTPVLEKVSELESEFKNEVSLIVDDGDKIGGVASTIVSIENNQVKVIRQGAVKIDALV